MKMVVRKEGIDRRHARLRKKIMGTAERPRMCVRVSNKHLYVQIVDDEKEVTLAAVASSAKGAGENAKNVAAATALGQQVAEVAKSKGITAVVFDRGGFKYHGRVKAIAEAVRQAGIKF